MIKDTLWFDWANVPMESLDGKRVYVGDACCEKRLPASSLAVAVASRLRDQGADLTLVTPFVTDVGLRHVSDTIEALRRVVGPLEVVCNDWGVLNMVAAMPGCVPIVGRILTHQATDPRWYGMMSSEFQRRFERDVRHVDGTVAHLCYAAPPSALARHTRRCPLIQPKTLQCLSALGVSRIEVNNLLQGLDCLPPSSWHVSLHVPDVLVTLARDCSQVPVAHSARGKGQCGSGCSSIPVVWAHESFPVNLYQVANGIYYLNPDIPADCDRLGVDRIIRREWAEQ